MHVSRLKSGYFKMSLLERHMLPKKGWTCLAKVLCVILPRLRHVLHTCKGLSMLDVLGDFHLTTSLKTTGLQCVMLRYCSSGDDLCPSMGIALLHHLQYCCSVQGRHVALES